MTTKITELTAKISANDVQILQAFARIQAKQKELAKSSASASMESASGLQSLAERAQSLTKDVGGVTGAFEELGTHGAGGIAEALEEAAKLSKFFGPGGAIAAGIAIGTLAFAAIGVEAAHAADEISEATRHVSVLLGLTEEQSADLLRDVKRVSDATNRTQGDVASLFEAIGNRGPKSADAVRELAQAGLELQKALGGDATAHAQGLQLITEIFGLDPTKAHEIAAALVEVASGRAALSDVLEVMTKIAPATQSLGFDFNTSAAAIARLLDQGHSVKNVAALFNELATQGSKGREELERLGAAGINVTEAVSKFDDALHVANAELESQGQRVRKDLNDQWLNFGTSTLPIVTSALKALNDMLDGNAKSADGVWQWLVKIGQAEGNFVHNKFGVPLRTPQGQGDQSGEVELTNVDKSGVDAMRASASALGKELSALQDQATSLGTRSAAQLEATQARLKDLLQRIPNSNDAMRESAQKLLKVIGEALPAAIKRSAAEEEQAAKRLSDVRLQARALLDTFSQAGPIENAQRQIDAWVASAARGKMPMLEFAGTLALLNANLAKVAQREKTDIALQFEDLVAQGTLTAVDDLAASLHRAVVEKERLAQRAEATNTPEGAAEAKQIREQLIPALIQANAQLREFVANTEAARQQQFHAAGAVGTPGPFGLDVGTLTDLLSKGKELASLKELLAKPDLDDGVREKAEQRVFEITGKRYETLKNIDDLSARAPTRMSELVRTTSESITQMLTLVDAAGGLDDNIVNSVKSATSLFTQVEGIAALASKEGGFSKLFSGTGPGGKASQSQGISQSISIVGAVIAFGQAMDLFGSQRDERIRTLRVYAADFNRTLALYGNLHESSLAQQLRENLDRANDLIKQGMKSIGATFEGHFDSAAEIQAQIDQFTTDAGNEKLPLQLRKQIMGWRDALQEVLPVLQANEAELERENALRLKQANEDLEVRALIASGQSEDAERLRRQHEEERAQLDGLTEFGADYVESLKTIEAAEDAATAATLRRSKALSQLSDENEILPGTAKDKLKNTLKTFSGLFADFGGLDFGAVDSKRGLETLRAKLIAKFQELDADGISEAEQPTVDAIKQILSGIDAALGELPADLDPVASALESFSERVKVFGLSSAEQFAGLLPLLQQKFGDALSGLDINGPGGLSGLKSTLQGKISDLLAGGITDEERPLLEAFEQLLDLITGMMDDAAKQAAQAVQDAANARKKRVDDANVDIAIEGLTGVDAIRARLHAYGDAFADLFNTFDLNTLSGVTGAKDELKALLHQIEGMSDDEIFAKFGLTRDEIIAAMLELNSSLGPLIDSFGNATQAALDLANATKDFVDSIDDEFLRSTGHSQEADIKAAEAKRDDRLKKAKDLGLGQDKIDEILALFDADVKTINDKYAQALVDAATVANKTADAAPTPVADTSSRTFIGTIDPTGVALMGVLRQIEQSDRITATNTTTLAALFSSLRGPSLIQVPQVPSYGARGFAATSTVSDGGFTLVIQNYVTLPPGSIVVGNASDIGDGIGNALANSPSFMNKLDNGLAKIGVQKRRNQGLS